MGSIHNTTLKHVSVQPPHRGSHDSRVRLGHLPAPRMDHRTPDRPTDLQRMGAGHVLGGLAMAIAGTVEIFRKKASTTEANSSELHILWQVPQYVVMGMSEVLMYVPLMDFFHVEMPDGFKSFGCASACRPRQSAITSTMSSSPSSTRTPPLTVFRAGSPTPH